MRVQKTDLPTLRMPHVLEVMNADQEFPEIASPDSGRAPERPRRAARSAENGATGINFTFSCSPREFALHSGTMLNLDPS